MGTVAKMGEPLKVQRISKRFGGISALDGASLSLSLGKVTGLVGPNGAGKTTLFNIITGFLPPDSGHVYLDGKDITREPAHQISRLGLGRTFQNIRIFEHMSVLDNILVAFPSQPGENIFRALLGDPLGRQTERRNRERALDLLKFVGLLEKTHHLASELSYGQTKRLSLARLLAMDPQVLLLDEPTSGLDPNVLREMLGMIKSLQAQGKTICLIEHNLDVVREVADWVAFMDQGKVVAEGPPQQIMSDQELARIYFGF